MEPKEPKEPISDRKLAANRENSKKSPGPRTAKGKAASRFNALIHGALAKHGVVTGPPLLEDPKEYLSLLEGNRAHFNPVGILEDNVVQQITDDIWNVGRLARYKSAGATERLYAAISAIGRRKEEQAWTDVHSGKPAVRLLGELESSQVVTSQMLQNQIDLVHHLKADNLEIEEEEAFLAFVCDSTLSSEGLPGGLSNGDRTAEVRTYLAGIGEAEREELKASFISNATAVLATMYRDRVHAAAEEAAIERSLVPEIGELEKIMRYDSHLSRQVERKIEMLSKLQAARREREGGGA
jgi:hypothetical protein